MGIRGLVEHLSRGVVLRRRLPGQFGKLPIYVTPEAGLRYWSLMSRVDPFLYRTVEELVQPGYVVWDVGANVGLFSFCAAALSGPSGFVLSIEPDLWLAHLISRSSQQICKNGFKCSPVKVLCASVSDTNRISELAVAERERAANHLVGTTGSTQAHGQRYSQLTPTMTLDSMLDYFPKPSVVKIDVETHEPNALRGAKRLLHEMRPTVVCEVAHANSPEVTTLSMKPNTTFSEPKPGHTYLPIRPGSTPSPSQGKAELRFVVLASLIVLRA